MVFMSVSNFTVKIAFPLANFIIFFCSLTTFYLGAEDKKLNPQQNYVDFKLALIFCPTLLLGTKFGVILNNIIPNLYLQLILMFFLVFSGTKIYTKYIIYLKRVLISSVTKKSTKKKNYKTQK